MGGSAKGTPFESPVRRAGLKMRPTPPCQRYGIRTLGTNPGPSARMAQGGRMNPSALRPAIESGTFGAMVPEPSSDGYAITLCRIGFLESDVWSTWLAYGDEVCGVASLRGLNPFSTNRPRDCAHGYSCFIPCGDSRVKLRKL